MRPNSTNNDSNNNESSSSTIHGRIIIHDRNRVQSEVLPIYFNHASFASLRRQLSYFSFVRVGKSRQNDVMYTNDAVVDLCDILKLKRRTTATSSTTAVPPAPTSPWAAIATPTTMLVGHQGQVEESMLLTGSVKDSSQRKVRLHSLDLRDVLRQQQQQEQLQQQQQQQKEHLHHSNVSSAADVASAVLSGTLHAAKSNDNLDTTTAIARSSSSSKSISGGGSGVMIRVRAPVLPLCHRRSTPLTSSYADSSMSHSSDNEEVEEEGEEEDVSNNKSSSITGSNDDDEDVLQQHHHHAANHNTNMLRKNITNNSSSNNFKHRQHQQSSTTIVTKQNSIITHKDRTKKLDRLLSVNNIVPFIHLPSSKHSATNKSLSRSNKKRRKMSKKEEAATTTTEEEYVEMIVGGMSTLKEHNMTRRERAGSDAAINALLALGSHSM